MRTVYPPLADQITFVHGPRDLLKRYVTLAEEALVDRGIRVKLRTDFERLVEVNAANRDSWPAFIPMFNPMYAALRIDDAFWIEAVDESGRVVATHAGHLFDWRETTLARELTSLRAFFNDPAPHLAAGDSIEVDAPSAERITGRVLGGGAVWCHPDHRQSGLATLVPKISRAYALTRWNIDCAWAVMEPRIRDGGLARRHGFTVEDGINFHLKTWRDDLYMLLVWMTREEAFAEIVEAVHQGTLETVPAATPRRLA
ncbi:MAG TPA: hypothetical protein VET85_00490, partial [Stellaceae bacterium]|nr:hypothetical protein [Stellaceae bacterium]